MSKLGKYLIATGSVTSSHKPNNIYRKIIEYIKNRIF